MGRWEKRGEGRGGEGTVGKGIRTGEMSRVDGMRGKGVER